MLTIFRGNSKKEFDKKFANFSNQLAQAFAHIKNDVQEINSKLSVNQSEFERIYQWIGYLNKINQRVSDEHSKLLLKYAEIDKNQQQLHSSHVEMKNKHHNMTSLAKTLEKGHQGLSGALSAHKEELKTELYASLKHHQELSQREFTRLREGLTEFSSHIHSQKAKEASLREEIGKLNQDINSTFSRLDGLVKGLKGENEQLKNQLTSVGGELQKTKEEIKNTKEMTKKHIDSLKSETKTQNIAPQPVIQPAQPAIQQVGATPSNFQKHIISRVMPNRKGYVLKYVLDMIAENQYSTKEIEEIIVGEKQLCGRTSFYAYLKELKLKGRIGYAEIDDRSILVCTNPQQKLQ